MTKYKQQNDLYTMWGIFKNWASTRQNEVEPLILRNTIMLYVEFHFEKNTIQVQNQMQAHLGG
jgi:hypothetical protein